jgi:hypothetical protein
MLDLSGAIFSIGFAIVAIRRGSIPLKRGGAIARARDPLGFWGLVLGFTALAAIFAWTGIAGSTAPCGGRSVSTSAAIPANGLTPAR